MVRRARGVRRVGLHVHRARAHARARTEAEVVATRGSLEEARLRQAEAEEIGWAVHGVCPAFSRPRFSVATRGAWPIDGVHQGFSPRREESSPDALQIL